MNSMNFSNAPKNQTENDKGQLTQNIDILKQLIDYPNLSRSLKMNSYGLYIFVFIWTGHRLFNSVRSKRPL